LDRAFLVDLGSTHGTFIGSIRLEDHKPTQLPIDSTFHFGASTRYYTLREKPSQKSGTHREGGETGSEDIETHPLPETEPELDNLTEFNTAHNKRISMLGIPDEETRPHPRKRKQGVTFKEEEDVINPEDVEPTVGKFRNLVQTAVIPKKKARLSQGSGLGLQERPFSVLRPSSGMGSNMTLGSASHPQSGSSSLFSNTMSAKLGIHLPNPAPDVEESHSPEPMVAGPSSEALYPELAEGGDQPKKKKYAKEAWPGRKPGSLLM
jgi:nuclear inhibitor of protein phosphatase 1